MNLLNVCCNELMDGKIDEVRIFNRVLSESEVIKLKELDHPDYLGDRKTNPGSSCLKIHQSDSSLVDKKYWIDITPDETGDHSSILP